MRKAEVGTQEDNISHIGQEIVNSVSLRGMKRVSLMTPYPSPVEDCPTKNRLIEHIEHRRTTTETVS